jgi:rRNA-processing protein FCF1
MAAKRKISIRKILQTLLTLSVTSCCVVAIVSASDIEDEKVLKSVAIHYNNCKKYHSVEEQEIMDLAITNRNIDILHTPSLQAGHSCYGENN